MYVFIPLIAKSLQLGPEMPIKDPERRKLKQAEYSKTYYEKNKTQVMEDAIKYYFTKCESEKDGKIITLSLPKPTIDLWQSYINNCNNYFGINITLEEFIVHNAEDFVWKRKTEFELTNAKSRCGAVEASPENNYENDQRGGALLL